MNWLDFVLLILLVVSAVTAFSKGITREVIGLISVVGALILSSWLYGMVGASLQPYVNSRSTANLCGFLLVFLGVMILGGLVGALIARLLRITGLSFVDRLLGLLFGVARGLLLAAALVMAIMAFSPGTSPQAVVDSRYSPYVVDASRAMAAVAPHELKEGFLKSYEQVRSIWKDALKKGIHSLPVKKRNRMNEKFESLVDHLMGSGFSLEEAVQILEKTLIGRALDRTTGNRSAAAKMLGIHRNTLQRKMVEYELAPAKRKPVRRARAMRKQSKKTA